MTSRRPPPALPADGVRGRVSAVVPTIGGPWLEECLAALAAQEHPDLEVVVVDDGAEEPEALHARLAAARDALPRIVTPRLPRRVGFAAAANAGLRAASGEWLFLLNDDAAPGPGAVAALVGAAVEAGAGIAGPRIVWAGRGGVLDNAGHALYGDGLNWCRGRGEPARGGLLRRGDLLLPSGAAMLVHRGVLARIGLLDEGFGAYGEDAELGLRAARAGVRGVYVPEASVEHRVSASYGADSARKVFLVERNRARLAAAHLPFADLAFSPLRTLVRHAAFAAARVRRVAPREDLPPLARALPALCLAHAASLVGLPSDLRRRARLAWLPRDASFRARLRAHRLPAAALAGLRAPPWAD